MTRDLHFDILAAARSLILAELAERGPDWWLRIALPLVSYWNMERARAMGDLYVDVMDLAECLRILDAAWHLVEARHELSPRWHYLVKQLKAARNTYAHPVSSDPTGMEAWDEAAGRTFVGLARRLVDAAAA
jgi:hypothetical protein